MSHLQNVPVSEIAVDGGSLLCCLYERTELLLLNLLSHNGPPCRSGSSVCGLPTSLCDDARRSSVGLSLLFHATLPRPGQSGMMRTTHLSF